MCVRERVCMRNEREGVTEELFTTMEIQLIKAAVASGNLKVCVGMYGQLAVSGQA